MKTISGEISRMHPKHLSKLTFQIQGQGNVPSMKNGKMILWTQRRTMTDPKKQVWMEKAISSLMSQLRGLFPTEEGAMRGECRKLLQTVSFPLFDDSMDYMMPGKQSVRYVEKGFEGCIITIEPVDKKK